MSRRVLAHFSVGLHPLYRETAHSRFWHLPFLHSSEVKMPAIIQHLDVPELRLELNVSQRI